MIVLPSGADSKDNPRIGYDDRINSASLSADEEAANHPVSELGNDLTFLYWQGESSSAQSVVADLGQSRTIDYFGIARHNFGSAGISYVIEYSSNGTDWSEAASEQVVDDDNVILHQFPEQTARYWRIRMLSGSSPPRIAVWLAGQILVAQRRIYVGHTPINYGREIQVSTGRSENGEFLGRVVRRRLFRSSFELSNLKPAWYRDNFEPFVDEANEGKPFLFAWRPNSYPDEIGFVWAMSDIRPSNQRANGMMQVSVDIQGILS